MVRTVWENGVWQRRRESKHSTRDKKTNRAQVGDEFGGFAK
jgi:hypothetical protein